MTWSEESRTDFAVGAVAVLILCIGAWIYAVGDMSDGD
jgi:hypothetical protein